MYTELFQELGLAQNEARIYETLLREGESSVGHISAEAKVHRRNVYDSLNRLIEKGLVFEIMQRNENRYQPVDPHKLAETIDEKQHALSKVMPELEKLYQGKPHHDEVYVYRGLEGWKNYMREILRVGEDWYSIGAKAALNSHKLPGFFEMFRTELGKKNITSYNLYDPSVKGTEYEGHLGSSYRFLPKEYHTSCTVIILADRIFLFSGITLGDFNEDFSFTVIVNAELAKAYKIWWQFMWDMCPAVKKPK